MFLDVAYRNNENKNTSSNSGKETEGAYPGTGGRPSTCKRCVCLELGTAH